ncbi:phage tail tape measure protein [Pseudomonas sp. Seg1]|uniref:phage tail tape measure protein n=1 Tax=Pseudomonas sp. Seg1 TaxID=2678259 RepID=UPI001BB44489|nr:phage tail tape measure protein [Pseudomonas sp. Seg1]BBP71117.1 phage tail tape measure protein [Pseudomonas sp. Seg1]
MAQESRLAIIIDSRNARQQVDDLRNSLNGLQSAGGQATVSVNGLGNAARAAAGVLAGLGVGRLASGLLEMTDRFKTMAGQINLVSSSTAEASRTFETLKAMANSTGSSLESTVTLFTRMSNATRGAGFSQEQLLKATDAVNKAFLVSSATQQEATSASIQLSQAMASGVLRGEELNSVMEQAPRITRALSEYLGVTNGQIRAMAAEGKITSEIVMNALLRSLTSLNKEVETMPPLFERAAQVLKNNFLAAIGQVNTQPAIDSVKALGEAFASPEIIGNIKTLSSSLSSIASVGVQGFQGLVSNIDALIAITGAYAAKTGTGLVISLAASAKARYDSITATQAQIVAERQAEVVSTAAAAQTTRKAVTDEAAALAASQRALVEVAATRSMQANSVAQLQSVQQQLAADRALETQRLKSQITDVGRQQSLARLAEIRRAEAAVTIQQAQAQTALNQTLGREAIAQSQVTAGNARLSASREADTIATNQQNAAQLRLNASQGAGSRLSAGLLGLAGGPIGAITTALALLAGTALYFATSSKSATQALIDQNLTIDDSIAKFKALNDEQRQYQSSNWMAKQKEETDSAAKALEQYRDKATQALIYSGQFAGSTREEFEKFFSQVQSGQQSLGSLTRWLSSNTQITNEYKTSLIGLANTYSSSSEDAARYGELLARSQQASDGASASTKNLAGAHGASVTAVSGGSQAWEKYISQLTQTRDLIGANAAQEAAYSAAKAGFTAQQIQYARLTGEQTDLLKKYEQAVKDRNKVEMESLRSQITASYAAIQAAEDVVAAKKKADLEAAKSAEESAKRQITALEKVAAASYAALITKPQEQQNLAGYGLLTNGKTEPVKPRKTPEQQAQEAMDRITSGVTPNKAPKGKSDTSKISAAKTAFDELYKAAQPAKFALQDYVEKQGQLSLLLSKGKITQDEYNEALAQVSINYAAAIKGAQGLTQAEQYRAQLEKQLSTQRTQYDLEAGAVGMGDKEAARLEQRVQLEQQTNDRILQLRTELANATTEKQRQDLQAQIDLTNEYLPKQVAAMEDGFRKIDAAQGDWTNGARSAFQNYADQAADVAGQTRTLFTNAFSNMEDGIIQFVKTGKLSFKDLADGIIADLIRIQIRQAAVGIFGSLFSDFAGAGASAAGNGFAAGSSAATSSSLGASAAGYTSKFGFSDGGYTGDGGKYEPKGVVHGGEFVVRKDVVAQPGAREFLERMNASTKGYADGGFVGSTSGAKASNAAPASSTSGAGPVIEQHFSFQGTPDDATISMVKEAAMQGAKGGYELVVRDLKQNGTIRQLIARR